MKKIFLLLAVLIGSSMLSCVLFAQVPLPEPKPIIGGRVPALSPDGKKLAFVYRGDVWITDSAGGNAMPLTRNVEMDTCPQFSPDGKWISFSSNRNGNWDIYLVPAAGGPVQRVTHHSSGDTAWGWHPNGSQLLFTSRRDTKDGALHTIDLKTSRLRKLAEDFEGMSYANYSPDGSMIVFGRLGFPWTRPRYNGASAMQIWTLDTKTGKRRMIIGDGKQHLWSRFMPDGKSIITVTYGEPTPQSPKLNDVPKKFVDSAARTPNLWIFDLKGKGRQITQFVGGSVRFPNVAAKTGDIVFEYDKDLWLLKSGEKTPKKLSIIASQDDAQSVVRYERLTTGAGEGEPSPDGKYYMFGLKGDIWTVLIDKPKTIEGKQAEFARRLTEWVGDDSDFLWSQDGKKAYFRSDREMNTRVYELDIETLKVRPLWNSKQDASGITLTPDGKSLAFWVNGSVDERGLYLVDIASGKSSRIVKYRGQRGLDFKFSPDMKWLAYVYEEINGTRNIWVMPAEGGDAVNITRLNAYHSMPTWSPDGKYLFFRSNRDGDGLYVVPLTKEPARLSDFDIKFEMPKEPVKIAIDFEDINLRIRKHSSQTPDGDMHITDVGKIYFLSGGDVWTVSYDAKESKKVSNGGGFGSLRIAKDGKKLYCMKNGELLTMKPENGETTKVTYTCEWNRDVREERKAAFAQIWQSFNSRFYDPNMHGRDWEAIRSRYEPMLEAVETREEFATFLNMMVGELESSHSEIGAASGGNPSSSTPHLGFSFDYSYEGPGIKVGKVPEGAPGSYAQTRIKPGEYVMAINGQDVTVNEDLFKMLNNKGGRELQILVNSTPTKVGARTVKYTCPGWGEWDSIHYKNRIKRLRGYTEEKSGGKIGYIHVSAMGFNNQVQFERDFYEYSLGKDAMILDFRFNNGGNVADNLISWMEKEPYSYYFPRDGICVENPRNAWNKPIIILINEHSVSNGEMFPCFMREKGLAKLVGMPTPGYVIWTGDFQLVDGTYARMPGGGVYRADGTNMENCGEKPDYEVYLSPDDWNADRDPQLDKALELLKGKK